MKKENKSIMKNSIFRIALATGAILMIPVLGRFPWGILDFVAMGTLLFGTGMALDFASKKLKNKTHRILASIGIVSALFIIWTELAVEAVSKAIIWFF